MFIKEDENFRSLRAKVTEFTDSEPTDMKTA